MALVHENLYRAGNFSKVSMEDHIKTLSASIVRAYGINGAEVVLVTDIEDILLGIDRAISVGLIVNELVSNALKHAFPDGRSGQVRIELARSGENRCVLAVVDDGAGLPQKIDPNRAESMGLQLVHDLSQQINGTISVKRAGGTSFTVTFFTEEQMEPTQ
jgi:two-component sensor histidine kinase